MNMHQSQSPRNLRSDPSGAATAVSAQPSRAQRLLHSIQSGYTVIFQSTYYTLILYMFLGLVYDFGGVGYAVVIANNAVRLAAQNAAKEIDVQTYIDTQEVRLSVDAEQTARDTVSGLTDNGVQVTNVTVNRLITRDVVMVEAEVTVDLPILASLFGMRPVTIQIEAYAEPAFGIVEEGQ